MPAVVKVASVAAESKRRLRGLGVTRHSEHSPLIGTIAPLLVSPGLVVGAGGAVVYGLAEGGVGAAGGEADCGGDAFE
jgi:hypothetical protein